MSVIIPVRSEPETARAVAAVLDQEGSESLAEVVVVGSGVPPLPADARVVQVATDPGCTPGANRNRGIGRAAGRYLIFLDADCRPRPGWLRALVAALERTPVASGAVALAAGGYAATAYNVATFARFREGLPAGRRTFLPTLTLAVRREVVDAVGRLDESLHRCEDMDWTMRMRAAGIPLEFVPGAVVEHSPGGSLRTALAKWRDSGGVSVAVRRRHAGAEGAVAGLHPLAFLLLAPARALGATLRTFGSPGLWPYLHTLPAVYATKVAWCLGAAHASRGGRR